MSHATAAHDSFTVVRRFPAPPARVFAAFADPAQKARWFAGPAGWTPLARHAEFREGGSEHASGRFANGTVTRFDAHYLDIVPDRRIVYSYVMHIDDRRISVSLATVEMVPDGTGTRLVVTEQGVFLDGYQDNGAREHGTGYLMDRLGETLDD